MDSTSLCSLEYVKDYLGAEGIDVTVDGVLEVLIVAVTRFIQNYTDYLLFEEDYTEYFDGDLTDIVIPKQYPVNSVSKLYDDTERVFGVDTLIDSTTYVIVDKIIIRLFNTGGYFSIGVQNIKLTYNAGYSEIPPDLQQACCEIVAWKYSCGRGGGNLNILSKTRQDLSTTYKDDPIPDSALLVLDKYKRFA